MIFTEMAYNLQSLAHEGLSNEWINTGIQNALRSRKFKAVIAIGILSSAYDGSVMLNNLDHEEYTDTATSALHVGVELAVVGGLKKLIPNMELAIEQNPVAEQLTDPQPHFAGTALPV